MLLEVALCLLLRLFDRVTYAYTALLGGVGESLPKELLTSPFHARITSDSAGAQFRCPVPRHSFKSPSST